MLYLCLLLLLILSSGHYSSTCTSDMEIETVDLQIGCLETVPDFSTLVEYFSVVILPDVALWLQKVIEYLSYI